MKLLTFLLICLCGYLKAQDSDSSSVGSMQEALLNPLKINRLYLGCGNRLTKDIVKLKNLRSLMFVDCCTKILPNSMSRMDSLRKITIEKTNIPTNLYIIPNLSVLSLTIIGLTHSNLT